MEKVSSPYADRASVNVYAGDEIVGKVTREKARAMKASGEYFFVNHGKDIKRVTQLGPAPTELDKHFGWNVDHQMRSSALNRGAATHTGDGLTARWHKVPGYPVPYAFEGHLTMPRAKVINAGDPVHGTCVET